MMKDRFPTIVFLWQGFMGSLLLPGFFGEKMLAENLLIA